MARSPSATESFSSFSCTLRLAAHAGGVEQLYAPAAPVPIDGDGIAGDAGFRAGQQPLLADESVDQRRFAGIRAADDSDAHRLGFVIGGFAVGIRFGDVLADQHVAFGRKIVGVFLVLGEAALLAKRLDDGVAQVGHALAVLGRNRDRLAEPGLPRFEQAGFRGARFGFVGGQHDRLAGLAHDVGEGPVVGQQAGAGIHRKITRSASRMAMSVCWRMRPCSVSGAAVSKPAVSMTSKLQIVEFCRMDAAVAGDARRVVDERQLLARQTVEQRRLADIRPADDGNLEGHQDAPPEPVISSDIMPARSRMLRRRRFVGHDLVEEHQRILGSACLPGGKAERLARRVPQRIGFVGQHLDALRNILVGAVVNKDIAGTEPRHIADRLRYGAVGGNLVELGYGAGEVALVGQHRRRTHAGEQRVGAVAALSRDRLSAFSASSCLPSLARVSACANASPEASALLSTHHS